MSTFKFIVDGNYVNFLKGGFLARRLHNSSRAIAWDYDDTSPLRINFWVAGQYLGNINISEIEIDGVTCSALADFETNIKIIFPGYAGGGGSLDIDGLAAADALTGTEEVPVFQGSNKKTTTQDIADLGGGITLDGSSPQSITKVWAGSQAQYDGLTPNASTLYFIV